MLTPILNTLDSDNKIHQVKSFWFIKASQVEIRSPSYRLKKIKDKHRHPALK